MNKKMRKLADKLRTMHVTENPVNLTGDDYGYKYFICFNNTNTVVRRCNSIKEMIETIKDIIEHGVTVGSHTFY